MTALACLLGSLVAAGLVGAVVALRPPAPALGGAGVPAAPGTAVAGRSARWLAGGPAAVDRLTLRLVLGGVLAAAAGIVTGWPVAAALLGLAGVAAPSLMGGGAERKARLGRIEGIAAWAEMLRDTMAGAGGLEQSILATAPVAPAAIRPQVMRLAARLERERLAPSLRAFADELDDRAGDLVVAALILAADKSPKRLGDLLGRLAQAARAEVNMRLRTEAGRARTRTSVRVITLFTSGFAAFLVLFNRAYLDPYDSLLGQLVLLLVGGCFAGAYAWLAHSFRIEGEDRLLGEEMAP